MKTYTQLSYFRDLQQEPAVLTCSQCGGELYCGEVYYDIGGHTVCRDCLDVFARRYFRFCRRQAAWRDAL